MNYAKNVALRQESISQRILETLDKKWMIKGYVIYWVLDTYERDVPYPESVGRVLRSMAMKGKIKSKVNEFNLVMYKK